MGGRSGKTRRVAPNARRSVRPFGAGLELLSHVRLRYQEREANDAFIRLTLLVIEEMQRNIKVS